MRTHHSTSLALTITTAVVILVAACSSSDENDVASAGTTVPTTARATADVDGENAVIVYRDLTAYEIGLCWRNEDGSIAYPVGAAVPGPDATIGTVHLYVPFDLAGTRLTDVATFTRCSLEPM
jgi:hypothetical protein